MTIKDLIIIIIILIAVTFVYSLVNINKDYKYDMDILILPNSLTKSNNNEITINSRKLTLPIITNPYRYIKVIITNENKEVISEGLLTANQQGTAVIEQYLPKEIFKEKISILLFLDIYESNLSYANKIITLNIDDSNDIIMNYASKVNEEKEILELFKNTTIVFGRDENFMNVTFENTKNPSLNFIKDFIKYTLTDQKYTIELFKQTYNLNDNVNIYLNEEKVARINSNTTTWYEGDKNIIWPH